MRPLPPRDNPTDVGPVSDRSASADDVLAAPRLITADPSAPLRAGMAVSPRLPRRRRNQICIAILALGLADYLAYTLTYAALGGDAHNGHREIVQDENGRSRAVYYVRGHFIHSLSGRARAVSRWVWIYSYLHSISVPLTSGAMIISMLVLARPHILATMRGGLVSGQTFVTAFGTVVILVTLGVTALFAWDFIESLTGGIEPR